VKPVRRIKPIERLVDNMNILEDMVTNPERFGAFILLQKIKSNKSKVPTNINLLSFKIKMEKEIRTINRKIKRKLGFELPSGLK
jgi:hypothetical protein